MISEPINDHTGLRQIFFFRVLYSFNILDLSGSVSDAWSWSSTSSLIILYIMLEADKQEKLTRQENKTSWQDKMTRQAYKTSWQDKMTRQADRKGDKTCWQDRRTGKADKTCWQDRRTNQAEKQADKTSKDLITLVL